MRLLIDTHVLFWVTMSTAQLSRHARAILENDENEILVSVASAWEIAIKVGIGRWPEARGLIVDFERYVESSGFDLLQITVAHTRSAGQMVIEHRDPFDRLLAAQALAEGLTLVTADEKLALLGVPVVW